MKSLKIFNKILLIILYILFFLASIYLVFLINSKDPKDVDMRRTLKSILKNNTFNLNIFNDYNEKFLPKTQFINLNFERINLDFLNLNRCYERNCYTFYLEQHQNNLILTDRFGIFKYINFNELNKVKLNFQSIKSNLKLDTILDTFIIDDHIYVSGKKITNDEVVLSVVKAKIDYEKLNFENLINLKSTQCFFRHSIHSGKIQSYKNHRNKIILSINSSADNEGMENLSSDSVCGKILLINVENKNYEIYSNGHRNIIGLYSDENIILATEHGPFAGDEINNIKQGLSYGWPVASYGEKYSRGQSNESPNYKKNHKKFGFEEPIFSFIPAIGISEIIKLPNNFSEMWQDNFLVASLNGKHLYRVRFDDNFEKIIYHEKIFIGDRIRDIIYNFDSKKIYMSLEQGGELGILSLSK